MFNKVAISFDLKLWQHKLIKCSWQHWFNQTPKPLKFVKESGVSKKVPGKKSLLNGALRLATTTGKCCLLNEIVFNFQGKLHLTGFLVTSKATEKRTSTLSPCMLPNEPKLTRVVQVGLELYPDKVNVKELSLESQWTVNNQMPFELLFKMNWKMRMETRGNLGTGRRVTTAQREQDQRLVVEFILLLLGFQVLWSVY